MSIWFYLVSAIALVLLVDVVRLRIIHKNMKESILRGVFTSLLSRPKIARAIHEEAQHEDFITEVTGGDESVLGEKAKKAEQLMHEKRLAADEAKSKSNPSHSLGNAVLASRLQGE